MSQQPPRVLFQKPWRSHAHLVALLQQRGLVVADAVAAAAFFAYLSYYRFSGYCLASDLVYIRNLCAHHARLWDRIWTIKPERPAGKDWQAPYLPSNSRLFVTLLILRHLMKRIPAVAQFASQWQARVARHLATPPAVSHWRDLMGLPPHWNTHPAWQ